MPKIVIRNVDNTTAGIDLNEENVVFVPGNIGANKNIEGLANQFILFETLADFKDAIGDACPKYDEETRPFGKLDPGYLLAAFLLGKGFKVLYCVVADGEGERINTLNELAQALETLDVEELKDKSLYNIRFLTNAGYSTANADSSTNVVYEVATTFELGTTYYVEDEQPDEYVVADPQPTQATLDGYVIEIVDNQSDFETKQPLFIYIEGVGYTQVSSYQAGLTYYGLIPVADKKTYYVQKTITVASGIPAIITQLKTIAEARQDCIFLADHTYDLGKKFNEVNTILNIATTIKSSYGAMFSPWCTYNVEGESIVFPASVAYLDAFATSIVSNPVWYAVAGPLRGGFNGIPIYKYGDRVQQAMSRASDDIGVAVNAIIKDKALGDIIYGNRTLYPSNGLVASSFLNVRQLAIDITKLAYVQAKRYMFEQNDDRLWFNFESDLVSLLEEMKSGRGIRDYEIHKLSTNIKGQLKVLIEVVPIEAVENFDITIALVDGVATVTLG